MPAVDINFSLVAPLIALAAGALVVLVFDLVLPARAAVGWWYAASLGAIALSGYYTWSLWPQVAGGGTLSAYAGAFVADRFSLVMNAILLGTALFTVLLSTVRSEEDMSGYLALILWAAMGMMVLAGSGNLMTVFLGLEIFSLALYVNVAFKPRNSASKEAAFKYLILGSVASGMLLFGSALTYGATGSLSFRGIADAVAASGIDGLGLYMKAGLGLALTGFAFKLALVPFHVWSPDAYEGAPTPVTAFMSVGTKAAAFAGLVRFLAGALPPAALPAAVQGKYLLPLWVLAAASMLLGSMAALKQQSLKRLLAYSGMAHAGYLFLALPALTAEGVGAATFYLASYLFFNMGAFAAIEYLGRSGRDGSDLDSWSGVFYSRPGLAMIFSLFLFALTGMPPTSGFTGKLMLALAAVHGGGWFLLTILIISTGISAYAYLRVIGTMAKKGVAEAPATRDASPAAEVAVAGPSSGDAALPASVVNAALVLALVLTAAGTLWLGIMPGGLMATVSNLVVF
ncbi:MAG: NADH-quinone oxidoreductase subunit N [Bacillota bacterium]